jgi:enoyl-[acyl-carrier protein] reductase II
VDPITAAIGSFAAAKMINLPIWKVIPGLLFRWKDMYKLSLFGSATKRIMAATVDGNLDTGVQFIGQTQGLINDIPTVQDLVDRCIIEALQIHKENDTKFIFPKE